MFQGSVGIFLEMMIPNLYYIMKTRWKSQFPSIKKMIFTNQKWIKPRHFHPFNENGCLRVPLGGPSQLVSV